MTAPAGAAPTKKVRATGCVISLVLLVLAIAIAVGGTLLLRSSFRGEVNKLNQRTFTVPGSGTFQLGAGDWGVWEKGVLGDLEASQVTIKNTSSGASVTATSATQTKNGLPTVKTTTTDDGTTWQQMVKFTTPSEGNYEITVADSASSATAGIGPDASTDLDQTGVMLLVAWGVSALLLFLSFVFGVVWIARKALGGKKGDASPGPPPGAVGYGAPAGGYPPQAAGYPPQPAAPTAYPQAQPQYPPQPEAPTAPPQYPPQNPPQAPAPAQPQPQPQYPPAPPTGQPQAPYPEPQPPQAPPSAPQPPDSGGPTAF